MINCLIFFLTVFFLLKPSFQSCQSIPNCIDCPVPPICLQCETDYHLYNNLCSLKLKQQKFSTHPTPKLHEDHKFAISQTLFFSGIGGNPADSCGYWLASLQICIFCNEGYQLILGQCKRKVQKCVQLSQNGQCVKCIQNMFLEKNGNCLDLNCEKNGYYNCEVCREGYVKNFFDICLDPNCQTSNNGKCTKCIQGFQLKENSNLCQIIGSVTTTTTTTVVVKNVTKKQTIRTVITQTNITQITTIITSIIRISSGCWLYDPRGGCHRCKEKFQQKNGICLAIDKFCKEFDPVSKECLQCKQNYELMNKRCVSKDPSQNCRVFQNEKCKQCIDRYYLLNEICLQVDRSCETYNSTNGFCLSCPEGYKLVNSKCVLTFSVVPTGSQDEDNESISLISEFSKYYCLEYKEDTDYCLTCYARFYANRGFCWRVDPLCRTYHSKNGNCLSCYQGYMLDDNKCLVDLETNPLQNCKQYDPQSKLCTACMKKYYLFEGICLQVYPQCRDYDDQTGECTSCYNGYFLLQGQCQVVAIALSVPFCQNYNPLDPRHCMKCVSGYYLEANTCKQVSSACGAYNDRTGFCLNCISRIYKLINGRCILRIENCIVIGNDGKCKRCLDRYRLVDEKCIE